GENEIGVEHQVTAGDQRKNRYRGRKEARGLSENRVARVQGGVFAECAQRPLMERIVAREQRNDHAGVSESLHGGERAWSAARGPADSLRGGHRVGKSQRGL